MDARTQNCDSTVSTSPSCDDFLASRLPHRIRIIGGRHRGRVIRVPAVGYLRPTPDRVRETLFNWLGQDLSGRRTLDLFSGTGALSLEALSRGAALAVAVDRNPALVRALQATAAVLGADGLEAHVADAEVFLARERRAFDVVFLDPPFDTDPWSWLLPRAMLLMSAHGFIYAEAPRELAPPRDAVTWRHARAGQVHYHLLRNDASLAAATG